MKKYLIYITLIITATLNSYNLLALDSVEMNCIRVNPDGSVTIIWENPTDLSNFKQYNIYYSTGGWFAKLDSIYSTTTSYTHNTNLGNLIELSYYIDIVDLSNVSSLSDTIKALHLQLDNNEDDYNKADLYFNLISDPPPQGTIGDYQIYWDYPDGNWNLIGTSDTGFFSTDIIVCNDSINFKVELENQNGCTSVSNIAGNWFKDTSLPDRVFFDSVSINDNSEAVFGWQQPSPIGDVTAYIISKIINGIWEDIDTVNNTFYIDDTYNACTEKFSYAIAAIDSCGYDGLASQEWPVRPIFLYDVGFNVCAQQDTLVWEKYLNSEPPLEHYLIWRNQNSSGFIIVDSVDAAPAPNPPPGIQSGQMWYIDQGIDPGSNYEYYVQAVFGDNTSSSCKKTVNTFSYKLPQHIYFANADVLPNNEIELLVDVDTSVYSCTWELLRLDPLAIIYENFSSIQKSQLQGFPLNVLDDNVIPQTTYYEYHTLVIDSCGIERIESNILRTIHLSGNKADEATNSIEWNAFEGWETPVEKYYIYRLSGNENNFYLIDSVNGQTLTYDDIIDPEQASDGKFSYFVEAKQSIGGAYNYQAFSRSNITDLFFDSKVFFPNAFRPGGINYEFKPLFTYFSGSNYLFQVYNRWGQMIFETTAPDEGWNGTAEGKSLSSGLFIYRLTYNNIHGIDIEKNGTVMLVK